VSTLPLTRRLFQNPATGTAVLGLCAGFLALPFLNLFLAPGSALHIPHLIVTIVGKCCASRSWRCRST
jgi:hypothetical protein